MTIDNATEVCSSATMPSVQDYFNASPTYVIPLAVVGATLLAISLMVFIRTLRHILRQGPSKAKTFTAFVTSIYPVCAFLSCCSLVVPRSSLLCEALTQGLLMAALYQLFCLLISYSGGHAALVAQAGPVRLSLKEPPCCCWPCCSLPTFIIDKRAIYWLKCLVLQVPLVQGLVYFGFLVMWVEDQGIYERYYWYLQPVLIISILSAVWALTMTIKALSGLLDPEFRLRTKFNILQGVLLCSKLQPVIIKVFVWTGVLPCNPPLGPQLYANMIQNSLMIMEMSILGLIVGRIYKRKLPEIGSLKDKEGDMFDGKRHGVDNPSYT